MLASFVTAPWIIAILAGWSGSFLGDFEAYWLAGERVRAGASLYFTPAGEADPMVHYAYRYAPWFAWLWAPLTLLPKPLTMAGWFIVLGACGLYSVWSLRRHPAILLLGPSVLAAAWYGNVQMLMVAGLLYGVDRRTGPLWIALAASLKAVPILLVLVYVGRGQWARAGLTVALTALLVAPMLAYDLSAYPVGQTQLIGLAREAPVIWAALALLSVGLTVALARTRYAWLAASSAALISLPRFALYEMTLLLPALAARQEASRASVSAVCRTHLGHCHGPS
jgi:hypothetical protein